MAIDYTSDIGMLRLLIGDTNEDSLVFSDEQLQAFLLMYGNNRELSAIAVLESWATKLCTESGDNYKIGDIEYQEGRSKAQQMLSMINDRKNSIEKGLTPSCLGVGVTTGIYTAQTDTRYERMLGDELNVPEVTDKMYDIINYDNMDGVSN